MSDPLYKKIYLELKNKIVTKEYDLGDQLPTEAELVELFSVSKITINKALKTLMDEGFIIRQKGRGTFVNIEAADLISKAQSLESSDLKIGLIFTDFFPHYGIDLIKSIEKACQGKAQFLFSLSQDNTENEKSVIQSFKNSQVDGIIVLPSRSTYLNSELVQLVIDDFPVVFIDLNIQLYNQFSVSTNNQLAVYEGLDYIQQKKHEKIAICYSATGDTVQNERIEAIKSYCTQNALAIPQQYWLDNVNSTAPSFSEADIANVADFITRSPEITAYFALSYEVGETLRLAAEKLNKNIPEDLGILCFDAPPTYYHQPFFTHIKQNEQLIGTTAVDLLFKLINHENVQEKTFLIPAYLEAGKSL